MTSILDKLSSFRRRVWSVLAVLLVGSMLNSVQRLEAQEAAPGAPSSGDQETSPEVVKLGEFVVSASVEPQRAIDSAVGVTTIDAGAINIAMPRSGPELMQLVPGFYVETAGGEGRANPYARGIPDAGGWVFNGLQEDGLGVLSDTATRSVQPDLLTTLTGNIARVEGIRGGPSGVFMNNASAGIIGFFNREGTSVQQGEFTEEVGTFKQLKESFWLSGPLSGGQKIFPLFQNATYAVSVDYRKDDGLRAPADCGFTANDGCSVSGNIKFPFANGRGYFKVSAKWEDERTKFYVDTPFANPSNPQTIPGGPDLRYGDIESPDLRRGVSLDNTPDGPQHPDLADGNQPRMHYIGTDLDVQLADGLRLKNLNRFTHVNFTYNILLTAADPIPMQTMANNIAAGAGGQFAAALGSSGNYNYSISYPGAPNVTITNPATLNGNGLSILETEQTAHPIVDDYQDDLRLTKTMWEGSSLTAGLFAAEFTASGHQWGYTLVTDIAPQEHRLDFTYLNATTGASLGNATYEGMTQASTSGSYRNNQAWEHDLAPYLDFEQKWGKWTFDSGVRREHKTTAITTDVNSLYNLNPTGQNIPALRNATYSSGVFFTMPYDITATAWTAGLNYEFTNRFSAYFRWMNGYRMSNPEDLLTQARGKNPDPGPTCRVVQAEAGVKYSTKQFAVFASVIDNSLTNQLFAGSLFNAAGNLIANNFYRNTAGKSLELESFITPIDSITFHLTATAQDTHYANDVYVSGIDSTGKSIILNINGDRVLRIPDLYGIASVIYNLPKQSWGRLAVNIDEQYIGKRAGDEANRLWLAAYEQTAVGVSLTSGRTTFRVQVQNLFNSAGLTETDPRLVTQEIANPQATYFNGRTIFPRSTVASVSYSF